MNLNLVVAGVGGQGSILASHIIAEAAIISNCSKPQYNVRVGETFGAAMRGGAVASHVRIGEVFAPLVRRGQANMVLALEPLEGLRISVDYLAKDGLAIFNTEPVFPVDVKTGSSVYPSIDKIVASLEELGSKVVTINATNLALKAGNEKTISVVMLGAAFASGLFPFSEEALLEAIKNRVPKKTLDINKYAFQLGKESCIKALSEKQVRVLG